MTKKLSGWFLALTLLTGTAAADSHEYRPVQRLLDLSGLAWIGENRFLAVHDAKNPDELGRTRVSFLKTPNSLDGIMWKPLDVSFPGDVSSDLESAARIPGKNLVLLGESSDDAGPYRRIFLARFGQNSIEVEDSIEWTSFSDAFNVEATAVVQTPNGYLFVWAERNTGKPNTKIHWSSITLEPFEIGAPLGSITFSLDERFVGSDGKLLYSRAIVGMDFDDTGTLYTVAAYDPEGTVKNPDNGPFRSAVLRIGRADKAGVTLDPEAEILATVDGFKTESVVAVERDNEIWLFIGTDDENYGGTLRPLPR